MKGVPLSLLYYESLEIFSILSAGCKYDCYSDTDFFTDLSLEKKCGDIRFMIKPISYHGRERKRAFKISTIYDIISDLETLCEYNDRNATLKDRVNSYINRRIIESEGR